MLKVRRPVMRYHGGKWRLAPWIISHFPPHKVYVEPYGGGGSVLLRKTRSYAEVYNDIWDDVVNVFRVLRDPETAAELERRLRLTPFARREFEETEKFQSVSDPIERARLTIFRSHAGHGSAAINGQPTGFRSNTTRSGTTPALDWARYPDEVRIYVERLRGVVIENRPALEVIQKYDGPETLHYVDPTYPLSTRSLDRGNALYVHDMTDDDHRELAKLLRSVKGHVIISEYPCALYDQELYPDWHRVDRLTFADGARPRTEVLWLSPGCSRRLLL